MEGVLSVALCLHMRTTVPDKGKHAAKAQNISIIRNVLHLQKRCKFQKHSGKSKSDTTTETYCKWKKSKTNTLKSEAKSKVQNKCVRKTLLFQTTQRKRSGPPRGALSGAASTPETPDEGVCFWCGGKSGGKTLLAVAWLLNCQSKAECEKECVPFYVSSPLCSAFHQRQLWSISMLLTRLRLCIISVFAAWLLLMYLFRLPAAFLHCCICFGFFNVCLNCHRFWSLFALIGHHGKVTEVVV